MRVKYNLLQFFRDRDSLFWAIGIPMIMGFIFTVMFGQGQFVGDTVPVAIVVEQETNLSNEFLERATYLEQNDLLIVTVTNYENAVEMLRLNQVTGVVLAGDTIELILIGTGSLQSVLEGVVNEFLIRNNSLANIAQLRPEYLGQAAIAIDSYVSTNTPIRDVPVGGTANLFFVLLAMASFAGAGRGLTSGLNLQARISDVAARLSVAPTKKIQLFLENLSSTVICHTFITVLLMIFYIFVLGANFGNRLGLVLLTVLVASFASVSFGMFFSMAVPCSPEKIGGYLMMLVYTFATTAGLIITEIRILVQETVPILDRINIVAIISDTFLALVIHDDLSRYIQQLIILFGIAIVSIIIGAAALRRKSYVNI